MLVQSWLLVEKKEFKVCVVIKWQDNYSVGVCVLK